MSTSFNAQRLWVTSDGTHCLMIEREDAPRFEICVLQGDNVLRHDRLYARASAQVLAETWRSSLAALDVGAA